MILIRWWFRTKKNPVAFSPAVHIYIYVSIYVYIYFSACSGDVNESIIFRKRWKLTYWRHVCADTDLACTSTEHMWSSTSSSCVSTSANGFSPWASSLDLCDGERKKKSSVVLSSAALFVFNQRLFTSAAQKKRKKKHPTLMPGCCSSSLIAHKKSKWSWMAEEIFPEFLYGMNRNSFPLALISF